MYHPHMKALAMSINCVTHCCAALQACLGEEGELVAFPDSEVAAEGEEAAMEEVPWEVEEDLMTRPPVAEVCPS